METCAHFENGCLGMLLLSDFVAGISASDTYKTLSYPATLKPRNRIF